MHRFILRALLAILALTGAHVAAAQSITFPVKDQTFTYGVQQLGNCPGVSWGNTGQTLGTRQANYTAIQACVIAACTAGKVGQLPDLPLQISGGLTATINGSSLKLGLNVPDLCPGLIGAPGGGSVISQWDTTQNAIVSAGSDPTSSNGFNGSIFRDLEVGVGGADGATTMRGFYWGRLYFSRIENLRCNRYAAGGSAFNVGTCWDHYGGASNYEFSNSISNLFLNSGQVSLFVRNLNGTGTDWSNLYGGGSGNTDRIPLSGPVFYIGGGFGGSFSQMNEEWVTANVILQINNYQNVAIDSMHPEGVNGSGFAPQVVNCASSTGVSIRGLEVYDWGSAASTGTPTLVQRFGDCKISIDGVEVRGNTTGTFGDMAVAWQLHGWNTGAEAGANTNVTIRNFIQQGNSGTLSLDTTLPAATYGAPTGLGTYTYNRGRSTTEGATIPVGNANFTAWGVHKNANYVCTTAISAARTGTVSEYMASTGQLANVPRAVDDMPYLYRNGSCTGAFNYQFARGRDSTLIGTALSAASTGYQLDAQLIQRDITNPDVAALADADATIYLQGARYRTIAPTVARTITISGNYSSAIATSAPRGSCITVAVAAGSAGTAVVNTISLAANTSGTFCTTNGTGTIARVQ